MTQLTTVKEKEHNAAENGGVLQVDAQTRQAPVRTKNSPGWTRHGTLRAEDFGFDHVFWEVLKAPIVGGSTGNNLFRPAEGRTQKKLHRA